MGGFLKGASNSSNTQPIATTMRLSTSLYGRPRGIGCGQTRSAGNLVAFMDFKSYKNKAPGGKGGVLGKGGGQYTYAVSAIVSLGEGPITSIETVYNGNSISFLTAQPADIITSLNQLGISYHVGFNFPVTFVLGSYPQTPWAYLVANHPSSAIGYQGEAQALFTNIGLGTSPTFPSFNFERTWGLHSSAGATTKDVNPADWITAFLTNADWGVQGFPAALLGDLSGYATFCRALGLFCSVDLSSQTSASAHLTDFMVATASSFVWSQGMLKIVTYGDRATTANGATFTPATAIYDLTASDFIRDGSSGGETSVKIVVKNPADMINSIQMEFLDRHYLYNPVPVEAKDDADILATGWENKSDLRSHHFWMDRRAAMQSAHLQLTRERVPCTYQFVVGPQFDLLDPMDVVSITEPALNLSQQLVQIIEIRENRDMTLSITAEPVLGTMESVSYAYQTPSGAGINSQEDPGSINAPIIFEPPALLAPSQVWAAVSPVNPSIWGGANVWVSTDGGSNYSQIGQITAASRQGLTTASYASVTRLFTGQTVDNSHTLSVNLTESAGELATATAADLAALTTLCYVGGELIAYQTATLTGFFTYNLTTVARGAYGSPIATHASGSPFARLDANIYEFPYAAALIGTTIMIKFQSFNIYGNAAQDLSLLTPYSYTITGGGSTRVDTYSPTTTSGNTTQTFTTPFAHGPNGSPTPYVTITWSVSAGDSLNVVSVSISDVVFQILNGGVAQVGISCSVTVTGY